MPLKFQRKLTVVESKERMSTTGGVEVCKSITSSFGLICIYTLKTLILDFYTIRNWMPFVTIYRGYFLICSKIKIYLYTSMDTKILNISLPNLSVCKKRSL